MKAKFNDIFILFLTLVFIGGCVGVKNDIDFARYCLQGLAKGKSSAAGLVDWTSFVAMGINIGGTVNKLAATRQKEEYVKKFIKSFAFSFRQTEGKLNKFTNWRIFAANMGKTTVAANYLNGKVLLLTIATYPGGKRKLIRMGWKE